MYIKYLYHVSTIRECVYVGHILPNISILLPQDEHDVCIRNSDFHKETGDGSINDFNVIA